VTRQRWSLAALVLVIGLSLLGASGIVDSSPTSTANRTAVLFAQVKCPSCEDLSVAQSTAPSSLAVRQTIERLVAGGKTNQQILDALVAVYGTTILLSPPTHGVALLVWIFPVVVAVTVVAVLVAMVRRSRRAV
jgi:cytochrome c-type biogenesis protein CcmH